VQSERLAHPAAPSIAAARQRSVGRLLRQGLLYLIITALSLIFVGPFLWTVGTSLKAPSEVYVFPPTFFPEVPKFENYARVFEKAPFGLFFRNTVIVAVVATFGTVLSTTLVAYGFARKRFPGRNLLFLVVISTLMLPFEVTIIPQFLLFRNLGWLDTLLPLIIPEFFAVGAFNIFLMRQFLMTIPLEFDEAAMIDGANALQILGRVLLPLMQPAIITVAILSFLGHWNDFFAPLIYLNSTENLTLSIGLRWFQTSGGYAGGDAGEPREHLLMAASLMATAPCVALFFLAQRYFVQGIVMSGIKG
jgi:multiple sugar transport system permease protein